MAIYERTATFEYDDYPDLTVVMRLSVPLGRYFDIARLLDDNETFGTEEGLQKVAALVDEFRESWTLEGTALDQPAELLIGIALSWARAISRVPVPLPRRSGDTAPSPEPSTDPEN